MKQKYNLALLPTTKSNHVVTLAHQFSHFADDYLLGKKALPHVTLYSLYADKKNIKLIWEDACTAWKKEGYAKSITLTFEQFSFITFDEITYCVSLLPDHSDLLHHLHSVMADVLKKPLKEKFDPHMTLFTSKDKTCEKAMEEFSHSYRPIKDTFSLALGKSDEVGQFTSIIHI